MNLKPVSVLIGCATVLLLPTPGKAAEAKIEFYRVVRQVSGFSASHLHYYTYTATYTSTQLAAYRQISNFDVARNWVSDIAWWTTSGSGTFTNPTPPISCGVRYGYYRLHIFINESLAAPGTPNSAEDWYETWPE